MTTINGSPSGSTMPTPPLEQDGRRSRRARALASASDLRDLHRVEIIDGTHAKADAPLRPTEYVDLQSTFGVSA
jgi:hypothetical protein